MASDTDNVKLGVCRVYFDGVDLGYTKGGVEVEVATETHKVTVDQFGNSEINEYIMGRTVRATVPLAETTLENLVRIMPGATMVGGGVKASGSFEFAAQPADGDTIVVNGITFTFKETPTLPSHLPIEADLGATLASAVVILNSSPNANVNVADYGATENSILVEYETEGTEGNAFTLDANSLNITPSGPTLTGGSGTSTARVDVKNGVGISLLETARELILRPKVLDDKNPVDTSEDFVIPLAATAGAMQFAYKIDEERIYNVEFTGYPNPDTQLLFRVGSPQAV